MRPSSSRHWGGSKVAATRSRHGVDAQPGEVDHVGVRADLLRAGDCGRRIGLVDGVDEHRLGEVEQGIDRLGVPVGRPHQRRDVGDHERVDDRVELLEMPGPEVEDDALAGKCELAGLVGVRGAAVRGHGDVRVDRRAPFLDRAQDRARGVVAAHALEAVEHLAAPLAVDHDDQVEHARGRVGLVALVLLLEQPAQRFVDRPRRGVLFAPNAAGVERHMVRQRCPAASSAFASSGPADPAG